MRRLHRRAGVAVTLAAAVIVSAVLPAGALPPIDATSTAGVHIQTVPQASVPGYGGGTAVGIAENGWVALSSGLWEGVGYPEFEVAPIPIPTNPQFTVTAIGHDGTIAGHSVSGSLKRGFVRFPNGTIEWLPIPPGNHSSLSTIKPEGISNEGYIAGSYYATGNTCGPVTTGICSFLMSPDGSGGYTVQVLPAVPPNDGRFTATSIGGLTSTTGIIVGGASRTWTSGGGYVDLQGGLAGGVAWDVNVDGSIAGHVVPVNGILQAAFWDSRGVAPTLIPRLGADTQNFAWGLNDADQVVGWSGTATSPNGTGKAFIWDSTGGTVALGQLPGGTWSEAKDITNDGKVVGNADFSRVIWDLDDDYDIDYPPDVGFGSAVTTVEEGDQLSLELAISDLEGDPFDVSVDGLPAAAMWDPGTTTLTWQTAPGDAGTYPYTFTVTQVSEPLNTITFPGSFEVLPPMVMAPIGDQSVNVPSELRIDTVVTGGVGELYSAYGGTPAAPAALPAGASLDFAGVFTWTPTVGQVGDHVITIEAVEVFGGLGRKVLETFTVSVFEPVSILVTESVTVVDLVAVRLPVEIFIIESVTVTDSVAVRPPVEISITETVTVTDGVAVRPPVVIVVVETVDVSDVVAVRPPVQISITETVGVSDVVVVTPAPYPEVSGTVWVDLDADGTRDPSEPGLAGVTVYADLDGNGSDDTGEPSGVTSASGSYTISDIEPGTFDVRAVIPPGYDQSFPATTHTVTATFGDVVAGLDVGGDPNGVDGDADGLADSVDGVIDIPGIVSMRAVSSDDFTDQHRTTAGGGTTYGVIVDRAGAQFLIADAAATSSGVQIVVDDETHERFVDLTMCGRPELVQVRDGSTATFTCGSLLVEVAEGLVIIGTSDGASVEVPGGSTVLIDDEPGLISVTAVVGPATVLVGDVVTDLVQGGTLLNPAASADPQLDAAALFVPLSPIRLFDTRPTEPGDGPKGKLGSQTAIDVQVGGKVGVPLDAVAVVMNVTVAEPDGPGFVTVYPTGTDRPNASSINIVQAGQTRPNLVTVLLGDDGKVSLFSRSGAHLLADIAGYYIDADTPVDAGRFVPVTPQRLFDTRPGEPAPGPKGKLGAKGTIDVQALGVGDIPSSGVSAIVINITATEADAAGFITGYPTGEARPLASNVNLDGAGATAPNLAIIPVGADGMLSFFSRNPAHLLGDVTGYITDGSVPVSTDGLFVPLEPTRVFDTREAESPPGPKGYVVADAMIDVDVGGAAGVPADAAGVVLNVTGIDSPLGFLTAWQRGPSRPVASTLNFAAPLDTRANAAMLPVGVDGQISFYTKNGSDMLADVSGYFLG